jgi:septum formation protein
MLALDFLVRPADVDESQRPSETPQAYVERLAKGKATLRTEPGECVLAADTIVVLEDEVLGKPADVDDAVEMITRLAGRAHEVLTAVTVAHHPAVLGNLEPSRLAHQLCTSIVWFRPMTPREVLWYARTGEGLDKAGAYGIQGVGGLFVDRIEGNYTNIVGLPLPAVSRCMHQLGLDLLAWSSLDASFSHPADSAGR